MASKDNYLERREGGEQKRRGNGREDVRGEKQEKGL
jgi:hypothetical protein